MLGLGDWEFCQGRDCGDREKLSRIEERSSARQWLQDCKPDLDKMLAMRDLLWRENSTWASPTMSNEEVIGQAGELLGLGGFHVHAHMAEVVPPRGATSGVPAPSAPFPISERKPPPPPGTSNLPPSDPPTFSPNLNAAAQAAALSAAAAGGQPFCPE